MERVVFVKGLKGYRLQVRFSDGVRGIVSVRDRLFGPVFEPLKDPAFFRKVKVDEYGAVFWPNGADLAPDALYEQIKSKERVA